MSKTYRGLLDIIQRVYQGKVRKASKKLGLDPILSDVFSRIYPYPYIHETEYRGKNIKFSVNSSLERPTQFKNELLDNIIENSDPNDIYFDIGAGIGTISCITGCHLNNGEVYAFEPLPANYEAIQRNFAQNSFESDAFQYALSDSNGDVEFSVPSEKTNSGYTNASLSPEEKSISHFWEDKKEKIKVQSIKGDDLIQKEDLPCPNIISIDVEGAEVDVIKGLEDTLSTDECRLVFVEVHKYLLNDFGTSSEELEDELRSLGFSLEIFDKREFEIEGEQGQLYRIAAHK